MNRYTATVPGRAPTADAHRRDPARQSIEGHFIAAVVAQLRAQAVPRIQHPLVQVFARYPPGPVPRAESLSSTIGAWAASAVVEAGVTAEPPTVQVAVRSFSDPIASTEVVVSDPGTRTFGEECEAALDFLHGRVRAAVRRIDDPNPARVGLGDARGPRTTIEDLFAFLDEIRWWAEVVAQAEDLGAQGSDDVIRWLERVRLGAAERLSEAV